MSAANDCRSGSESWSAAAHAAAGEQEAPTYTQGVTAVATEGCDDDLATDALTAAAPGAATEADATVRVGAAHHSRTSTDSWEELDPTDVEADSVVTQNPAFASEASRAVADTAEELAEPDAAAAAADTRAPPAPLCEDDASSVYLLGAPAPASAAPSEVTEALPTPPSNGCATSASDASGTHLSTSAQAEMSELTRLLMAETRAVAPWEVDPVEASPAAPEESSTVCSSAAQAVPESTVSLVDASWAPRAAVQEEVDVSELTRQLMGDLTPSWRNEATAPADDEAGESSAASEAVEMSDGIASVPCSDMQQRMTVMVDPDDEVAPRRATAVRPLPTGATEVLRRRVVEEDLLSSERSPSDLTEEERRQVIEALFGDFGAGPISAEKFREVMVPYRRHCDCLGASYGFHNRSCQFHVDDPVAL